MTDDGTEGDTDRDRGTDGKRQMSSEDKGGGIAVCASLNRNERGGIKSQFGERK